MSLIETRVPIGLQGNIHTAQTITLDGNLMNFMLTTTGVGGITYRTSWWTGSKILEPNSGIGASFAVPRSSPSWVTIGVLPAGTTVGFILDGVR